MLQAQGVDGSTGGMALSESSKCRPIDDRRTEETLVDPLLAEQLVTWVLALVIGVVLWSMGGKILRPSLGLTGLFLGATLGWLVWTQVQGHIPLWTLMLGSGIVTACVCMLAYKLVLAGLLSMLLSIFLMVAAWSLMESTNVDSPPSAPLSALGALVVGIPPVDVESTDDSDEHSSSAMYALAIQRSIRDRAEALLEAWRGLDPTVRLIVLGSLLAGVLLGLLFATFAIKPTAIFVTSVIGSLLILGSLARLISLSGASTPALQNWWTPLPVVLWGTLALIGILTQAMLLRARHRAGVAED
jgi:hypothetical protein